MLVRASPFLEKVRNVFIIKEEIIMYVVENNFNGGVLVPVEAKLSQKRIIFVEGEINAQKADEFAKQMMYLVLENGNEPITVLINSNGGELDAGLKMCDVVSECPCKVDAYCFGKAYSMAAILFESVNGDRNMVGHSKLMFHQPSIYGMNSGTVEEVEELSKQLKEKNELLLSIVAKRSNMSVSKLKKETEKDRYYDAKEAKEAGLTDHVVTFRDVLVNNSLFIDKENV